MGEPGFPSPLLAGYALPNPPTGWGKGKPGFPFPCLRVSSSRGRGRGETRFPHVHVRRSCAWRTTPDATGPGARASRPCHGSAGTATAPSVTLPRWGREPGASPQRGEAGRGAEPCERWSPQEGCAPGTSGRETPVRLQAGVAPPRPSHRVGEGATRFPHPPA